MIRYLKEVPVAIDLMSVILPTNVYLDLIEKFDPRVPLMNTLEEVFKSTAITELKNINVKMEAVYGCTKMVQEVTGKFM